VKPGACIDMITSTINGDIEQLTKRDVVDFWGGTNETGKYISQNGLRYLVNFVKNNSHTNVTIINVPHQHDLVNWLCVNREVRRFNRKLVKHMKVLKHLTVMKIDFDREMFTKHGLDMNNLEREKVMKQIVNTVLEILQKKTQEPISLQWKTNQDDGEGGVKIMGHIVIMLLLKNSV
jgi:hypothetical protein